MVDDNDDGAGDDGYSTLQGVTDTLGKFRNPKNFPLALISLPRSPEHFTLYLWNLEFSIVSSLQTLNLDVPLSQEAFQV